MLAPPQVDLPSPEHIGCHDLTAALWVGQHIQHLTPRLAELVEPAGAVAAQRHAPWWR